MTLVKMLLTEIKRLEARIEELEARSGGGPPATSRNSSLPPARDQKKNLDEKKSLKRVGAKPGHKGARRPRVEKPDQVIEVKVEQCAHCQADLRSVAAERIVRHQLAELPPMRPLVIETQMHEVECPSCHRLQRGAVPEGWDPLREFGPRLEAAVIYYKQEQHLSYERICETMRDLFGVELSEGGINAILRRGAEAAQPEAEKIAVGVAQSAIIGSDETSARVKGRNWWQWVFRSRAGIVHRIEPTRGAEVIREFMQENCAECWISDCFSAQLLAPAHHRQLCLAHQLRDCQRVIERDPELSWPVEVKELFSEAIDLWKRFSKQEQMTVEGYLRRVAEIERRLDQLLAEDQSATAAANLSERYLKHRDHLLLFLYYPGVEPDNNACERALRPSVIHRKVTNGFRSEWAAKGYAALETVIETAKLEGRRAFEVLVELMGKPVLPLLDLPDP